MAVASQGQDKVNINYKHSNGGTALLEATTGAEPDTMEVLLEAVAKYNFFDDNGFTQLMAVASQGQDKVNIDNEHSDGRTAPLQATVGGEPDVMEVLLEAKAKYIFFDHNGVTPLMAVASQG